MSVALIEETVAVTEVGVADGEADGSGGWVVGAGVPADNVGSKEDDEPVGTKVLGAGVLPLLGGVGCAVVGKGVAPIGVGTAVPENRVGSAVEGRGVVGSGVDPPPKGVGCGVVGMPVVPKKVGDSVPVDDGDGVGAKVPNCVGLGVSPIVGSGVWSGIVGAGVIGLGVVGGCGVGRGVGVIMFEGAMVIGETLFPSHRRYQVFDLLVLRWCFSLLLAPARRGAAAPSLFVCCCESDGSLAPSANMVSNTDSSERMCPTVKLLSRRSNDLSSEMVIPRTNRRRPYSKSLTTDTVASFSPPSNFTLVSFKPVAQLWM